MLLDIHIDPDANVYPMVAPGAAIDEMIGTKGYESKNVKFAHSVNLSWEWAAFCGLYGFSPVTSPHRRSPGRRRPAVLYSLSGQRKELDIFPLTPQLSAVVP